MPAIIDTGSSPYVSTGEGKYGEGEITGDGGEER